jgi:hypothetical protein
MLTQGESDEEQGGEEGREGEANEGKEGEAVEGEEDDDDDCGRIVRINMLSRVLVFH